MSPRAVQSEGRSGLPDAGIIHILIRRAMPHCAAIISWSSSRDLLTCMANILSRKAKKHHTDFLKAANGFQSNYVGERSPPSAAQI